MFLCRDCVICGSGLAIISCEPKQLTGFTRCPWCYNHLFVEMNSTCKRLLFDGFAHLYNYNFNLLRTDSIIIQPTRYLKLFYLNMTSVEYEACKSEKCE